MGFDDVRRQPPSLNLSALIDVVFILLIFVVLAANFDRIRSQDIQLPAAKASGEASGEALSLTITADGTIRLDGERLEESGLGERLRALRGERDTLLLLVDASVPFERASVVLGEASAAGFENLSIATREPRPK